MFGLIKKGLEKTRNLIREVVRGEVVEQKLPREVVEEALIEADIDYDLVEQIVEKLPAQVKREKLKQVLLQFFPAEGGRLEIDRKPYSILIVGVNGVGKTTTIGKLAHRLLKEGHSVILGAGDTFRAAAIEQLSIWAEKLGVPIVKTRQGHDPAAVAFDTIKKAEARGIEVAIIDTAGRLHNKAHLREELAKIVRVSKKADPGAPSLTLLVIDGTQGSSAVNQAKIFKESVGVDGIVITKLDGSAKGGSLFTIVNQLQLPIYFVGVGEGVEDLVPFDREEFIEGILEALYPENPQQS